MSTFTPKRLVNSLPLTERNSHEYTFDGVTFVKPQSFWYATQGEWGPKLGPYFTITDAVTSAMAEGWIIPPDTCRWCSGHGFVRVSDDYFDLTVCAECQGEGIDPQQPVEYVGGWTL